MLNGVPPYIKPYTPQINRHTVEKKPEKTQQERVKHQKEERSLDNQHDPQHQQRPQTAIDYTKPQVNIKDVLTDFKNTLSTINPDEDVNEEVVNYLNLAAKQAQKEKPSAKIIKSNLKNAASILDEYIAKSLNKPSDVVGNWIDALLLQKVDYKATAASTTKVEEITPKGSEKLKEISKEQEGTKAAIVPQAPEKKPVAQKVNIAEQPQVQKKPKVSRNQAIEHLKKLYKSAENYLEKGNLDKAYEGYNKSVQLAAKLNNKKIQPKIYMSMAYISELKNDAPGMIENYHKAATMAAKANNRKVQAEAHYNMGTIYDDYGELDAALGHYHKSLALDGAMDNIKGQTITLNNIANVHASKKQSSQALDLYKAAFSLAKQADDNEGKAIITSNVAGLFKDLGYDQKALQFYRDSIIYDQKGGNMEGCAKSYNQSGDIMLKQGRKDKAKNLYTKSLVISQKVNDKDWSLQMMAKIASL